MRITDWAINHPNRQIAVIIKDGKLMNNYAVKFNLGFINKGMTIKSECLYSKMTIRLEENNTFVHVLKEIVFKNSPTFFRGRKFSAIFFEEDVEVDILAIAKSSLDFSDNDVLFKPFRFED